MLPTRLLSSWPLTGVASQVRYPLRGDEKAPELLKTLFELGTEALVEALPSWWEGWVMMVVVMMMMMIDDDGDDDDDKDHDHDH
jgi:hypothetical protein